MMQNSLRLLFFCALPFFALSCASNAATAEEYYSIGMAYYELGKFPEAERWLLRAAAADKTKTASEYNLGRIAFETGRYEDASRHFENILKRDPDNVMTLKAAAYTRIKTGDISQAESLYNRVLTLVPESSDDGYNYALVLYALEKYEECQNILRKYPITLDEKPDSLLLLARSQAAANMVEAADNYAGWISKSTTANPVVLHEYAQVLEKAELYALALEQYKNCLAAIKDDLPNLKKNQIHFDMAKLLLTADPENPEAINELKSAVSEGFKNEEALQVLLLDNRINDEQKAEISKIIEEIAGKGMGTGE